MPNETKTINYVIGEHPDSPDIVIIQICGSGIDIGNPQHKHRLDLMAKVIATQLYAFTQGIEPENVIF